MLLGFPLDKGSLTLLQGYFQPVKGGTLHVEREHLFPVYLCKYFALQGVGASNNVET